MVVTFRVWQNHAVVEMMLAGALRERGAHVSMLSCGGGLPFCSVGWARRSYPRPCDRCAHFTDKVAEASGLEHRRLADHLPWGADARRAWDEPPAAGAIDYGRSGALTATWTLKTTQPEQVENGAAMLRDSAVTAAAVEEAFGRVLDEARPDVVLLTNGTLVEEDVMAKVARARGVRAVTYGYGIHEDSVMLSSAEEPALEARNEELWAEVRDTPLTPEEDAWLDRIVAERERGSGTADYFGAAGDGPEELRRALGVPAAARVVTLFTNLTWDSAALFKDVAFATTSDWVRHAVRVADANPELHLVVRVHPAEASAGTQEPAAAAARAEFAELPPNVHVIEGHEPVNSYALVDASDTVLVYTSTVGMEAALRGRPVVVAGRTHYRGRGFTIDAETADEVTAAMLGAEAPGPDRVALARRYAYAFFFRLMVPMPALVRQAGWQFAHVTPGQIDLRPGADPYLDLICDRILDGRPLSAPRELVRWPTPFPPGETSPYGREVDATEPALATDDAGVPSNRN
jgi:hypothetical protein